jgi:hypothetical protein
MNVPRWDLPTTTSAAEERLLARLSRTKKLFAFLRLNRQELFDDSFQDELSAMYRQTGQGRPPVPPALLAMAVLLQAYCGASDAEAVELTVVDARWQLVLGHLGETEPAFSQGALQAFRQRLIEHGLDRRLLERTAELAKASGGFDYKKLPKTLRLAVDSRPLEGAGRVEDTLNLLGRAARQLLRDAAEMAEREPDDVAEEIGARSFLASSIKKGLDVDWTSREAKKRGLEKLSLEIAAIERWVKTELADSVDEPPLATHIETLQRIRDQDLEPDPSGGGSRIKHGVAPDRQVSISDPEMRHGRKAASKTFNGYKSHLAVDLDGDVIWACAITPANQPEATALAAIQADMGERSAEDWHIDRGYIAAPEIRQAHANGVEIVARPWRQQREGRISKDAFRFNFRKKRVTCPGGQTLPFELGTAVRFDAKTCASCDVKRFCTDSKGGRNLNVLIDEPLQLRLRRAVATPEGRERLRERVKVEHRLAHHAKKQGRKARYVGLRSNLFDARRHAAVLNLEVAHARRAA